MLQADGGTRTASITGAYVALHQALKVLVTHQVLPRIPLRDMVAAVSVGILNGDLLLDLCYEEDFRAQVDFNLVLTKTGELVEMQGATEGAPFARDRVSDVVELAYQGVQPLFAVQQEAIRRL